MQKSKCKKKKRCFEFLLLNFTFVFFSVGINAQLQWKNVDTAFGPLPSSVHVYRSETLLDGKPNIAYYVEADPKDKKLDFLADTTLGRRLTPAQFYTKNLQPLVVVNTTFFSFATNQNLNVVIKKGRMVGFNNHTIPARGKDTFTYYHPLPSAIGINKKRQVKIAWLYTDSSARWPIAFEQPPVLLHDSLKLVSRNYFTTAIAKKNAMNHLLTVPEKWKMQTAVGGGPVLLQEGAIKITNNEEMRFSGKAIDDKHPRTAMGYTKDGRLIILVVEGRNAGIAEGASLLQLATIFRDLHCVEAINLDGGGSSCLLVNGKETIKVSDATGERPVPGVWLIRELIEK